MAVQRLPFVLSDFTRLIWTSAQAREVWAPRINNINEAWARIERWAVVEGARTSALTFFEASYLPEASMWAASHGLMLLPLARVGVADQYSATPKLVDESGRWQYRAVLTRPEFAKQWLEAWQDTGEGGRYRGTNNRAIGQLLGYPPCCIDFFERVWVKGGSVDTTWDMALGTPSGAMQGDTIRVSGPSECNILLRWLGVRLVAHLPCSFSCEATTKMARDFAEVGRQRHFGEWVDWMYEMLEWPVEWSALHGVAEVRTPVVTISTRTDATASTAIVQRDGKAYPEEGASGLRFPFRVVTGKVSDKPAYKRGADAVTPSHKLNGFGSQAAMQAAHETLLQVLPGAPGALLDLGCGDGRFLERAEALGWVVMGIEQDPERAAAATVPVKRGDLMDITLWAGQYDVVAFMPGRLFESAPQEQVEAVQHALRSRAKAVLLYAYGDWITRWGSLMELSAAAGFDPKLGWHFANPQQGVAASDGVQAALMVFTPAEGDTNHELTTTEAASS